MTTALRRLRRRLARDGTLIIEYGLVLALFGAAGATIASSFGPEIIEVWERAVAAP